METTNEDQDLELDPQLEGDRRPRGRKNGRGENIPDVVIRRLPIYARTLEYLLAEGMVHVSSEELGDRIEVSAAQIRRDLAYFGDFGKQGKGYNVQFLLTQMKDILRLQTDWNMAVVGLGHLGRALARYEGFRQGGFCITALFDHDPSKTGQRVGDLPIHPMSDLPRLLAEHEIQVALLAVPPAAAQEVADQLVAAGVRAILNYAPTVVKVPPHVRIRHIDPVVALQSMTYYLEPEEE